MLSSRPAAKIDTGGIPRRRLPAPRRCSMRPLRIVLLATLVLALAVPSIASAFNVVNNGITSYTIDAQTNPTLNLVRGQTYTFNINASGHPFYIKTIQGNGTLNQYTNGVTGNGT